MARFRTRMALRPVQRIKHVIDLSGTLNKATAINNLIVRASDTPTIASKPDVITGSKVYGFYLKLIVASNDPIDIGVIPNVYMGIFKNPGGNLTAPAINDVGSSDNKKYMIHQEMVMIENKGQGGNPHTLFDGVIKIPKNYSRFGPTDTLLCIVLSPQMDIAFCLQAHYKEFR